MAVSHVGTVVHGTCHRRARNPVRQRDKREPLYGGADICCASSWLAISQNSALATSTHYKAHLSYLPFFPCPAGCLSNSHLAGSSSRTFCLRGASQQAASACVCNTPPTPHLHPSGPIPVCLVPFYLLTKMETEACNFPVGNLITPVLSSIHKWNPLWS